MSPQMKTIILVILLLAGGFTGICTMNTAMKTSDKSSSSATDTENENAVIPGDSIPASATEAMQVSDLLNATYSDASNASDGSAMKQGDDWFNELIFRSIPEVTDDYFQDSVFIGESRTVSLVTYGGVQNLNVFANVSLNVGEIDTTANVSVNGQVMTVADAVNATSFSRYYLSFGLNEIGWPDPTQFTEGISHLADLILARNPSAVIYVQSIAPVTKAVSDSSVYSIEQIQNFNANLKLLCQGRGDLVYLDTASSVTGEDGYLPTDAGADGKQLNQAYCQRMMQYIRQHAVERIS